MEFILNLIGITLLFIGITTIMYKITRSSTEPTWLNVFCASFISICIVVALLAVMSITARAAITWEEAKEKIQYDITQEVLKANGYNAKLIYGADTRSASASMWHMWVAIKDEKNDYVLIETTKRPTIGSVIRYRPKDASQYHYFQGGMLLNNSDEYAYYHESDKTHWNAASALASAAT